VSEFATTIKHAGVPRKPTDVRRVDTGMTWRVVEVLSAERDVDHGGRRAEAVYRLRVFGPLPHRAARDGPFELIAVNYVQRPYWWVSLPPGL
jgi:hypothetical protein